MEIETGESNTQFGPAPKKARWAIFSKELLWEWLQDPCLPGWNFTLFFRDSFRLAITCKNHSTQRYYTPLKQWYWKWNAWFKKIIDFRILLYSGNVWEISFFLVWINGLKRLHEKKIIPEKPDPGIIKPGSR